MFATAMTATSDVDGIKVKLWELLATDVESIDGIGAVGTMLEKILL